MKYIFFCSRLDTMVAKRKELLMSLVSQGFDVALCSMETDAETERLLCASGVKYYSLSCTRNKISFGDLLYFLRVLLIIRSFKPDVCVTYTIKPNVYCGIACFFWGNIRFYPVVTGLGYAFQKPSLSRKVFRTLIIGLHKFSFSKAKFIIFQNHANAAFFKEANIARGAEYAVIEGDGVHLPQKCRSLRRQARQFVCVSRLLGEKGLRELNKAVSMVREVYPAFSVELFGPKESSPDAITVEELEEWRKCGGLLWRGYCRDVGGVLSSSDVFVLPSYHEGMSTAVCEAIAHGIPIVATNIPGIQEMVDGNGVLVPVRDVNALARALREMIELNDKSFFKMGVISREIAVSKFERVRVMKRIEKVITTI